MKRPCLDRWQLVIDYLTSAIGFEPREQFRVLYLDKRNNLIADEVMHEGTVDHTPVYPREVLRRAIELHATGCVLVHNHPSGDATPSRSDIDMTKQVAEVCGLLGIAVHDHVIIARDGHSSLRGLGLLWGQRDPANVNAEYQPTNEDGADKKDTNMKAKIWVLCTVLADENAPAMPALFTDEAEAWAKYDEVIRAEWENLMDADDGPYPGDPDEAQDRIRQAHGAEWSRWELTQHEIEIPAAG
jgi:hypothetical protein